MTEVNMQMGSVDGRHGGIYSITQMVVKLAQGDR